jgi:hypothetical protein
LVESGLSVGRRANNLKKSPWAGSFWPRHPDLAEGAGAALAEETKALVAE